MLPDGAVLKGIDAYNQPDYNSFLKIPDEIGNKPVIGVASYAFSYALIKYIQLPGTIKFIGSNAFIGSDLVSVTIMGRQTPIDIGECAFKDCSNLTQLKSIRIMSIHYKAFSGCNNLHDYGSLYVSRLETEAFYNCPVACLQLEDNVELVGGCFIGSNIQELDALNRINCSESVIAELIQKNIEVCMSPKAAANELVYMGVTVIHD